MSYRIKTSDITASAGLPLKKGSIDLINNEFQLLGSYTGQMFGKIGSGIANNAAIINGLVPTITGSSYAFTAGVVFYYGEFFSVPAATINVTGGNVPILTVVVNYVMGVDSDPVTFTDGSSHNVHQLRTMTISAGSSGTGTVNWEDVPYWNSPWISLTTGFTNASYRLLQGRYVFKGYINGSTGSFPTVIIPTYLRNTLVVGTQIGRRLLIGAANASKMVCANIDGFQISFLDATANSTGADQYDLSGLNGYIPFNLP